MSYGLKYTLNFREETGTSATGTLYTINIYASGYSGSTKALTASDNPITLSYKKQDLISPIIGSELTIGLMSTANEQYIEFATAAPLAYYVDILISTDNGNTYTTYWSGVNTTDCYTEPWEQPPYDINLKFNCGLGEIQWHRYENPTYLINGLESMIGIISNCLSFLPYQKNVREIINIREDTMSDLKGFLEQTYLLDTGFTEIADDGILHGINCNKLLNELLTAINCRIYQSNNKWYVERIWERTQASLTYYDYITSATILNPPYIYSHLATGTFSPIIAIANATTPKLLNGGDLATTQKNPALAYNFSGGAGGISNVELLVNSYFEDTPTSKNAKGQPTNWDLGSNLTNNGNMQLELVNPYTNDIKNRFGMSFAGVISPFNAMLKNLGPNKWNVWDSAAPYDSYDPSWSAHAVRRTGDTYSNPGQYIDIINGSLQGTFGFYFNFKVTPVTFISINQSMNPGGDAYKLVNNGAGIQLYLPIMITFTDSSGNVFTLTANLLAPQIGSWQKNLSYSPLAFIAYSLNALNTNNPDPAFTGQAVPLTSYQVAQLLQSAYNSGSYFNWKFNFNTQFNLSFPNSLNAPGQAMLADGVYEVNARVYPPLIFDGRGIPGIYGGQQLQRTNIVLEDFAVQTFDLQYKDSFNAVTGYTNFYESSDIDNRWNEKKVSVIFGDSLTPGYPGSFRLSNAAPTQTWHVNGNSKLYLFNTGLSGDPTSTKLLFNSATLATVTQINVSDTDDNSNNNTSWLSSFTVGSTLVVSDTTSGAQAIFTITGKTANSGYYAFGVTYVSGTGTFSAGDSLYFVYQGNQILADILFQNYQNLIAVYRKALTGKIYMPGGIGFWQNIEDEDGTVYAQTGNQLDFKKALLTINMEEVSTLLVNGNKAFGSLQYNNENTPPQRVIGAPAPNLPLSFSNTPVGRPVIIGNQPLNYPVA